MGRYHGAAAEKTTNIRTELDQTMSQLGVTLVQTRIGHSVRIDTARLLACKLQILSRVRTECISVARYTTQNVGFRVDEKIA